MDTVIIELQTKLKELNSKRLRLFVVNVLLFAVFTVVYIIVAFYLKNHYHINSKIVRYGCLPFIYVIYNYLKKRKDGFNKLYNEFIIEDVIRSKYSSWVYNQNATIDKDTVYQSYLVNKGSNMNINNNITGDIGNTKFNFAELKILKNQYIGGKLPKKIFQGYYFIFDNNKYIESRLFVRPRLFKDFGSVDFKEKKIVTDAVEFDKRFATFSDDPIKARYILTPALMARMIDFEKNYQDMISFLFYQDKLYIAIKEKKNFLEPPLHKKITADTISRQIDVFNLMGKIVVELNVDNNIWIKEKMKLGEV
nr:DUF3137 domain-containing protein [uncultured Clostridium sp.]